LALKPGELDLAVQLIEQLASAAFEPTKYEDEYRTKVLELIEQKVAGQEIVAAPAQPARAQIIDLMEALKASLAAKQAAAPAAEPTQRRPAQAKGRPAVARKVSAKAK
jgi:DNA end-binding protein Ku